MIGAAGGAVVGEMFVQQLPNVFSRLNVIYICFGAEAHFRKSVEFRLGKAKRGYKRRRLTGALGMAP